jgi:cysteinyl-tRNA synthetase
MESVSGKKPMVRYWMHTGFLNVKGEKMSKSLGNFITIKELMKEYPPDVFRFFVLSTHYRSPIDFSQEILEQSKKSLERLYKFYETIEKLLNENISKNTSITNVNTSKTTENEEFHSRLLENTRLNFLEAMDNDFNTPSALSLLFEFVRETNRNIDQEKISQKSLNNIQIFLKEIGEILGLNFTSKSKNTNDHLEEELVVILTDVREKLREKKDWELSDDIRSKLGNLNINLEDE